VRQAGAVAFRKREDILEVLLVRPSGSKPEWLFPKGHIEQGESEARTALRELREEAGVTGDLIGAVDQVLVFQSNQEQVAVRFYVVKLTAEEAPIESREHQWFPVAMAAEALNHCHNRFLLSEALPIIEGHLAQSGEGDGPFRDFLMAELQNTTESLFKNEEDGERRAMFFLTVVAGAGAVSAFTLGNSGYRVDQRPWPVIFVLVALLGFGCLVLLRVMTRNRQTDDYKRGLRRVRRWFTPNRSDPRRAWLPFDPFEEGHVRPSVSFVPRKGGWLEVMTLVIATLAGVLLAALVNTSSWLLEGIVLLAGVLVAWCALVAFARMVGSHHKTKKDDAACPFIRPAIPGVLSAESGCPKQCPAKRARELSQ
jgi:8-oxo-dGTP pyrophosphatase MutT (NUDIX family)